MKPVLDLMYGSIETNGTGGAAFRTIYLRFLEAVAERTCDTGLQAAAERLSIAERRWHELADGVKALAADAAARRTRSARQRRLDQLAEIASELYQAERVFYSVALEIA
jgi:hypothetical protein